MGAPGTRRLFSLQLQASWSAFGGQGQVGGCSGREQRLTFCGDWEAPRPHADSVFLRACMRQAEVGVPGSAIDSPGAKSTVEMSAFTPSIRQRSDTQTGS